MSLQQFVQSVQNALSAISRMTLSGILSISRKEVIQLMRDPYLVGFIIALPVIQLMVTGLAVERDLSHVDTIVCNYDKRNASIELLKDFQNSSLFNIDKIVETEAEVVQGIRRGQYRIGLIIPPDYSSQVLSGGHADVNVIIDGTQGTIAKTLYTGAKAIMANHTRKLMAEAKPVTGIEEVSGIEMNAKVLYNPEMKSAHFLVPAILAIIMHMLTILFTSFAIVREQESGTLEQLMVTPIRAVDLMVGKVLPYAVIGFMDMILTLVVMINFFDIQITGSFWFLCLGSIIFIMASLGMGLIISITCRTQVQAIQLTTAIFLPSLLLSGFVFPLEPMPWMIKAISYSLPLTYYLDIIRGVIIKGIGPAELMGQTLVLAGMATIMLVISIIGFKKQIA